MKINYPTLAVLSVLVLFAGLILTQPTLAHWRKKKPRSLRENWRKWTPPLRLYRSKLQKGKWNFDTMTKRKSVALKAESKVLPRRVEPQ